MNNLKQYGLDSHYLDVVVMDNSNPFWKDIPYVDSIITDRKLKFCCKVR